jgi:hypothetical protein
MPDKNDKSPHILNTSATLLGLCFIVLTSIKINNLKEATIIDELTVVAIVMFMISCILSFLSMRNAKIPGIRYEKIADIIFLAGIFSLFATSLLIAFNVIK